MAAAYTKSKGLKYFNIECVHSEALELIIETHGLLAYGVLVQLWGKIYHENGYFLNWDERSIRLFALKSRVDISYLKQVLDACFEEGLFCPKMFKEHQILTSIGIQKRWQKIVKEAKRKDTTIDEKFNLLENLPKYSGVFAKSSGVFAKNSEDFDKGKRIKNKGKKEREESECANAHTHTHEENFPFFENSSFSEKNRDEPAEPQKQTLVAEKKEKEKSCAQKEKAEKVQVRERVYLKPAEIEQLVRELGQQDYDFVVDRIDFYKGAKGRTYQDDFCAIKGWGITALHEHKAKNAQLVAQSPPETRVKSILSNHENYMRKRQQVIN